MQAPALAHLRGDFRLPLELRQCPDICPTAEFVQANSPVRWQTALSDRGGVGSSHFQAGTAVAWRLPIASPIRCGSCRAPRGRDGARSLATAILLCLAFVHCHRFGERTRALNWSARLPAAGSKGPISLQKFKGHENLADLSPQRRFIAIEPLERSVVGAA